jgi:hypothetical protein
VLIEVVYNGGLAHIQKSYATTKQSYIQHAEYAEYTKYTEDVKYGLISIDLCTPSVQKHWHIRVFHPVANLCINGEKKKKQILSI